MALKGKDMNVELKKPGDGMSSDSVRNDSGVGGTSVSQALDNLVGSGGILTALGDLLTHDGLIAQRLAVGAVGEVLKVDPGAPFGIKWMPDAISPTTTLGDISGHDGIAPARLAVGAPGEIIRANPIAPLGVEWAVEYVYVPPVTTTGDVFIFGAAAPDRLAAGTDGQVLMSDSSQVLGLRWIGTSPRTLYVDKQGSDTDGDGTPRNPYGTISGAIGIAIAMTPAPDTNTPVAIFIGPGVYAEQVIIERRGIHLYGWGQGVTAVNRAGNCLTIKDNGVDPEPWDVKIVGISFRSTDPAQYSVRIEGIAGSSLGGNEIQFRDGRMEGTKSLYCNLANYIDYQNEYIMGTQDYSQTAGVWIENSQHNGVITNDYDPAGLKPSDPGHYGINVSRSWIQQDIVLVNAGTVGDKFYAMQMTAKGAILGYSTKPEELPVGVVDGHVLTVRAASLLGIEWAPPAGGGGGDLKSDGTVPMAANFDMAGNNLGNLAGILNAAGADNLKYEDKNFAGGIFKCWTTTIPLYVQRDPGHPVCVILSQTGGGLVDPTGAMALVASGGIAPAWEVFYSEPPTGDDILYILSDGTGITAQTSYKNYMGHEFFEIFSDSAAMNGYARIYNDRLFYFGNDSASAIFRDSAMGDLMFMDPNTAGGLPVALSTLRYTPPVTTQGDLFGHDLFNPVRVPVGVDGRILTAKSSATPGISWELNPVDLLNTKGKLLSHTGAIIDSLAVGSNDQVLMADNTKAVGLKWGAVPGITLTFDAVVAVAGGDYTTLGAAITAGKKSIFAKVGVYTETGNVVLPADCMIFGEGKGVVFDFGALHTLTTGVRNTIMNAELQSSRDGLFVATGGDDAKFLNVEFHSTHLANPAGASYLVGDNNVARQGIQFISCKLNVDFNGSNTRGMFFDAIGGQVFVTELEVETGGDLHVDFMVFDGETWLDNIESVDTGAHAASRPTITVNGAAAFINGIRRGSLQTGTASEAHISNCHCNYFNIQGTNVEVTGHHGHMRVFGRADVGSSWLEGLEISGTADGSRFTGCKIEGTFTDHATADEIMFSNCTFTASVTFLGFIRDLSNNHFEVSCAIDSDMVNLVGGHTEGGMAVNGNDITVNGTRVGADAGGGANTITIGVAASRAMVTSCRTDAVIVDNSGAAVLANNIVY